MLRAQKMKHSTLLNLRGLVRNEHGLALISSRYRYTLAGLLEGDTISPTQLKVVLLKALEGLHSLHSLEYTHTNLSPSNILVSGDYEEVSITGFELA